MPHTEIKPHYEITFTHDEFRLVTMALAGIVKDKEDELACKVLNEHLCHQRHHMLQQTTDNAAKALEGAQKLIQ